VNQLLDAHYKRWMAQVIADTEAEHAKEQARRNEKARAEAMGPRERLTPLDERWSPSRPPCAVARGVNAIRGSSAQHFGN
jgi:hypothetical protein